MLSSDQEIRDRKSQQRGLISLVCHTMGYGKTVDRRANRLLSKSDLLHGNLQQIDRLCHNTVGK